MAKWLFYATISMLIWAVWSLVAPIASDGLSGGMVQILSSLGLLPVALVLLLTTKDLFRSSHLGKGIALAAATGIGAGLGNVFSYMSLNHGGPVSVVFPITALAPAVPVLLAVLFHERIALRHWGAIGVALIAVVFLNTNPDAPADWQSWSMSSPWMIYALLSLVVYGITYVPQKAATYFISDELSEVAFGMGFLVLDVVLLFVDPNLTWNIPVKAGVVSVFIGVLMGVGSLTLFSAYRHGKASIVTPYVQLFPVISVLVGVPLYNERIDLWRGIGIVAAIASGVVLSMEREPPPPLHDTALDGAG